MAGCFMPFAIPLNSGKANMYGRRCSVGDFQVYQVFTIGIVMRTWAVCGRGMFQSPSTVRVSSTSMSSPNALKQAIARTVTNAGPCGSRSKKCLLIQRLFTRIAKTSNKIQVVVEVVVVVVVVVAVVVVVVVVVVVLVVVLVVAVVVAVVVVVVAVVVVVVVVVAVAVAVAVVVAVAAAAAANNNTDMCLAFFSLFWLSVAEL